MLGPIAFPSAVKKWGAVVGRAPSDKPRNDKKQPQKQFSVHALLARPMAGKSASIFAQ